MGYSDGVYSQTLQTRTPWMPSSITVFITTLKRIRRISSRIVALALAQSKQGIKNELPFTKLRQLMLKLTWCISIGRYYHFLNVEGVAVRAIKHQAVDRWRCDLHTLGDALNLRINQYFVFLQLTSEFPISYLCLGAVCPEVFSIDIHALTVWFISYV